MDAEYSRGKYFREMTAYARKVYGIACGLTASNWIAFALTLGIGQNYIWSKNKL